jgi:UDP-glucose 4-epimerase
MKVAVTGSSGFFAKYVIDALIHHGYDIVGIDRKDGHPNESRFAFEKADLTVMQDALRALDGIEAVIHLAGIPHPLSDPADDVYKANALGTFVTAWAAGEVGVKKFIYASSESVLGTAFHPTKYIPEYFPIDERHPTEPVDPYGISKLAAEAAVFGAAQHFGFAAAALRMPWIWGTDNAERRELYKGLIAQYPNWFKNLWAFIDARDAAQAFVLALQADLEIGVLEKYYIVNDHTWVSPVRSSKSLIEEYFDGVKVNLDPDSGFSLISNAKAKRELDWKPVHGIESLD